MTKSLVGELSQVNIRINSISPGFVQTGHKHKNNEDELISMVPVGELAKPKDLDALMLYLSSNAASWYVTGSNFVIDGGISWGGQT